MFRDRTDEFRMLTRSKAIALPESLISKAMRAREMNIIPAEQAHRVILDQLHARQQQAQSEQARLHWYEAERIFEFWETKKQQQQSIRVPIPNRTGELNQLHARLEDVSAQFTIVSQLVASHNVKLTLVERSVDTISIRIDASAQQLEDAAPRKYKTRQWHCLPRSLPGRVRIAFGCVVILNLLFIYLALI